jgi:hypothetical protein
VYTSTTGVTQYLAGISNTSAAMPATDTQAYPTSTGEVRTQWLQPATIVGITGANILVLPTYDVTLTATTTLFLVAQATFTPSTLGAFGYLQAVRIKPYMTGRTGRVKLFFFGG